MHSYSSMYYSMYLKPPETLVAVTCHQQVEAALTIFRPQQVLVLADPELDIPPKSMQSN